MRCRVFIFLMLTAVLSVADEVVMDEPVPELAPDESIMDAAVANDVPPADPSAGVVTNEALEKATFVSAMTSSNTWHVWHEKWSSNVVDAARYLDRYFADPKLDEESNDSRIKLSLGVKFKEYEDVKLVNRLNLRLQLPGTSRRLKLVFEDLVESDNPGGANDVLNDFNESRPDAALRYNLRAKRRYKVDADVGVRLGSTDQVFTRVRSERRFQITEKTKLRLIESVRWWSVDGWVSLTQVEFDHQFTWDLLFRSKSELEWAEEEPGVKPMQTFSLIHARSRHRAYRLDLGGVWPESPDVTEANYFVNVTSRRRIHSNWLFLELKPGVEFRQDYDYDPRLYFTVQFDVILGRVDKD